MPRAVVVPQKMRIFASGKNTYYGERRADAHDEAVLRPEGKAPRCVAALPLWRLLRDIRRGRSHCVRDSGHHADKAQQRQGEHAFDRDGRISAPRTGHLSAQAGEGWQARGHLRPTRRPEADKDAGEARHHGTGDAGRDDERHSAHLQGEQLPGCRTLRQDGVRTGFPGHQHGRVPDGRGQHRLRGQAALVVRTKGGSLRARQEKHVRGQLRHTLCDVRTRRLGIRREHGKGQTAETLRRKESEGLRRRTPEERHRGLGRHLAIHGDDAAPAAGPHHGPATHRGGPLRAARQIYGAQPRVVQLDERGRHLAARRDRQDSDTDGRTYATALAGISAEGREADSRTAGCGGLLLPPPRPARTARRASAAHGRPGTHRRKG